jgi:hypothetical protein
MVLTSRSVSKPGRGWSLSHGEKAVGWYTQDFIVRRRKCTGCTFREHTVELLIDDIRGIVQESIHGHAPEYLTTKEKR